VVQVKLAGPASRAAADAGAGSQARRFGPALVGSGPLWLRGCRQVEVACASGEWLSLEGEPGTGKLALLRAVCRRRHPAGAFHVLDAADAGDHDWMARALSELLPAGFDASGQGAPADPRGALSALSLDAAKITVNAAALGKRFR